jgi:hypothetical protein
LVLFLVGAGFVAWVSLDKGSPNDSITPEARPVPTGHQHDPSAELQPLIEDGITPSGRVEAGPLPYREMPREFDGMGQISGELMPSGSDPMPDQWTLVIEPSLFAIGKETAERREIDFPGQQTTFEVRDLPFGSYRVFARTADQSTVPLEISLFKIKGPGNRAKDRSHVMLQLQPVASLHVQLRTKQMGPAMDLGLVLESRDTRKRLKATTDATGRYEFDHLAAGEYLLFVGSPDQPLLPTAEIQVAPGQVNAWEGVLPETHSVRFRVIDAEARPLPGAILRGHGGAPIDGITDFQGELHQLYLPAGTYRIRVEHAESEGRGNATVVVPIPQGQPDPVVIYCQP